MIKIRTQEEIDNYESVTLYDNNDNLIGVITSDASLIDARVQIKNLGVDGYYFIYNNEKIYIDIDGRMDFKNDRPFRDAVDLLIQLL